MAPELILALINKAADIFLAVYTSCPIEQRQQMWNDWITFWKPFNKVFLLLSARIEAGLEAQQK